MNGEFRRIEEVGGRLVFGSGGKDSMAREAGHLI